MSKLVICVNSGSSFSSYKEGDIIDILPDGAFVGNDAIKEYLIVEMVLTKQEEKDLKKEVKYINGDIKKRRRYKIDINNLELDMAKLKNKDIEYQPYLSRELSALSKSIIIDKGM